eukprot:1337343-Amorphochlora_amoeboformis.AAC.1
MTKLSETTGIPYTSSTVQIRAGSAKTIEPLFSISEECRQQVASVRPQLNPKLLIRGRDVGFNPHYTLRSGPATRSRSAGRTPSRSTRSTSQNRRTRRRSPEISKRLKELRYPINDMNGRVFILGLIREEEEEDVGNGDFVDPALLEDVEVEAEVVDKKLAATESFGDASATGSFGDASEVVLSSSKKPMSSFYWGIIVLLLCIMDIPLARVHYFKEISVITEAKSDLNVTMTEFMNETGAEAVDCIQLVQLDIGEETDEYCKVFCTEVKKLSEMRDQARDYVRDEHFYGGL